MSHSKFVLNKNLSKRPLPKEQNFAENIIDNLVDNNNINFNSDDQKFEPKIRVRKFSEAIRNELELHFLTNNFISGIQKTQLANKLNLTERQVQKWFK